MHEELKRSAPTGDEALRSELERLQRENNTLHQQMI